MLKKGKSIRRFLLLSWWITYFILGGLLGYLVAYLFFALVVMLALIVLSIFIYFFGDRMILAAINARGALVSRDLWRRANNMSARMGLGTIYLYSAPFSNPNIYYLQSGMGRASLVFGGGIEDKLSQEELDLIIYASLKIIKMKEVKAKMLVSFGHYFLALPQYGLGKVKFLSWLAGVYEFLAMPTHLMNKAVLNYLNMSLIDREVGRETGQNRELAGSIYKIGTLSGRNTTFIQKYIMNSLTYTDNKRDGNDFRLSGQDATSLRFQNLISEK